MKSFHKCIYFENGVYQEINNIILNFTSVTLSKHFIKRFMKRKKVKIPTKIDILQGELVEYCRNSDGTISKFLIKCESFWRKYDVFFVINKNGNLITAWTSRKHSDRELSNKNRTYFNPKDKKVVDL